jgi:glycosyltransferase involved in cell wall biosynthesis
MATRMLWEKGVGEYMETARLLRPRYPRVEFLLAGGPDQGNPASVPESHLADWNRTNLVRCLGHVAKIDELLAEVDLVVLPSYREGAPRILLETAAAGLPIVTTDVPGCREVVRHGVNGLLVPPRDAPALADAIASLIEHPERGRKMGLAGRNIALAEFDESIVIRRTLDVYRELMPSFRTAQADCAGSFA